MGKDRITAIASICHGVKPLLPDKPAGVDFRADAAHLHLSRPPIRASAATRQRP